MRRIASLAVVVVAGLLASSAPDFAGRAAWAQDKKKDEDKQKKREQQKREKNLKDIANDFGAKNVSALLNRVPHDGKVSLSLGGDNGDYSVDQARGVLDTYFGGVRTLSVDTESDKTSIQENVGFFPLTIQRKSKNKPEERKLQVKLGPVRDGSYTLAKLADNM